MPRAPLPPLFYPPIFVDMESQSQAKPYVKKEKMIINFFELILIKLKLLDNQPIGNNGIGFRLLVIHCTDRNFLCEFKNTVNFSNFFHFYYLFLWLFFLFNSISVSR